MKMTLFLLAALALAGCAADTTGRPNPPSAWLMARTCDLPPIPKDDGDPVTRADYEARLRTCAAGRGDQVRGLQQYARKVASSGVPK